jgi:hypothetical protein
VATSGLLPGSLVHIRIKMPVKLSQEQRQIMEDFARLETDTPGNNPKGAVSRYQSKYFFYNWWLSFGSESRTSGWILIIKDAPPMESKRNVLTVHSVKDKIC